MTPAPQPSSATDRTRYDQPSLLSRVLLGVLLAGCVQYTDERFEPYQVDTGSAERQTALTGFLLGGAVADLAVLHFDARNDRHLRIYGFEGGKWSPRVDATLSSDVLFVDVARIDGRDRLIVYAPGRVSWFDPESLTEHTLVVVRSNFSLPRPGEIPHVDVTRDLNADGRDELVVPDVDGFHVFVQKSDGTFADPLKVGSFVAFGGNYGTDGYRYDPWSQGRVHEIDYNRDGRRDLVYWNEDHFDVHRQDARGLFASVAETFTTDVAFDSDDLGSLVAPLGVRRRRKNHQPDGEPTGRVLHSLSDMNGDGVADLGVFVLRGGSLWRMHSDYEVHFGTPAPGGGIEFARDASTVIRADGIPFGLRLRDVDHDGQVDVMFMTITPGIFKAVGMIIDALLTDSVSVDLEFYRMDGGVYPEEPGVARKISSYPGASGERTAFSSVLIGDVNGDGRSDLLVQEGWEELHVYLGVPGPDVYARRPQRVAVHMPREEYTWLVDLNRDGKQDVLMHHRSSAEPNRLTVLIAR